MCTCANDENSWLRLEFWKEFYAAIYRFKIFNASTHRSVDVDLIYSRFKMRKKLGHTFKKSD